MKILHAINSANPAGGGPIEAIVQARYALDAIGHETEVVSLDRPDAPWLTDLPLAVYALGPAHTKYRYSPRYVPWLEENAKRFDCVILHGIWLYPSRGAWTALRKTGTPYFVYTHGMMDPTFRSLFPVRHAFKTAVWKLWEHRVMRDAHAVFFTCEEEKRLANQSFKPFSCSSAIVPYCVGEPPGDETRQKAAFYAQFPGLETKRLLLFLSRIHKKKGCDILVRAFADAAREAPDAHLVMAGPDSMNWQSTLEHEAQRLGIADRITWTGMLAGDLKWGAFRAADVFVLPSHQENFGIAVVEALACRLPVIITDRINIWREVREDNAGLVTKPNDDATAATLRKWLNLDLEARNAMRENAAKCFAERFRSDRAAANLLAVLQQFGVHA